MCSRTGPVIARAVVDRTPAQLSVKMMHPSVSKTKVLGNTETVTTSGSMSGVYTQPCVRGPPSIAKLDQQKPSDGATDNPQACSLYDSDASTVTEDFECDSIRGVTDTPKSAPPSDLEEMANFIVRGDGQIAKVPTRLSRQNYPSMPASLKPIIERQNANYESWLVDQETLRLDYLQGQIELLEAELELAVNREEELLKAKLLEHKRWSLRHRRPLGLMMMRLEEHRLVSAIRYDRGVGHSVLFWMFEDTLMETDVTPQFVNEFLMPSARQNGKYMGTAWTRPNRWDLRYHVMNTQYRSIMKLSGGRYQLNDYNRGAVVVSTHFAKLLVPPSTFDEARTRVGSEVTVTAGASARAGYFDAIDVSPTGPVVFYRNTHVGHPRDGDCMEFSFASAWHSIGLVDPMKKMVDDYTRKGDKPGNKQEQLENLMDSFRRNAKTRAYKAVYVGRSRKSFKPLKHCPLSDGTVVLAELRAQRISSIGYPEVEGTNHCVSFTGSHVFDANQSHAMPVNKESLDAICDSIVDGSTYLGIVWHIVVRLVPIRIKQEADCV